MDNALRAVVSVLGFDRKGIIAKVTTILYENQVNIVDISQTVLSGYFNMVLIVDISDPGCDFSTLSTQLQELGKEMGLQLRIQREEIFEAMHRI